MKAWKMPVVNGCVSFSHWEGAGKSIRVSEKPYGTWLCLSPDIHCRVQPLNPWNQLIFHSI
jgi:hypothetical protein